jgi:hypothetical protein
MYVVAILNEGSVEHYAKHISGFVVEHDLSIAAHRERHLLLFCESKNDPFIVIFGVFFFGGVNECLSYVHAVAMENFKKRRACIVAHVGNPVELNPAKTLDCG